MFIKYVLAVSLLMLAACAPVPGQAVIFASTTNPSAIPTLTAAPISTPVPNSTGDSGIYGQVTVGPTCPVQRINDPCPDKPYQATLTVLTTTDRSKVIQFQTDANGNFRVALAAGEYILHPESPGFLPRGHDQNFTVPPHEFVQLNVSYDSGIR